LGGRDEEVPAIGELAVARPRPVFRFGDQPKAS
jgi:hypothetical protein